jgi:hypothetical protein
MHFKTIFASTISVIIFHVVKTMTHGVVHLGPYCPESVVTSDEPYFSTPAPSAANSNLQNSPSNTDIHPAQEAEMPEKRKQGASSELETSSAFAKRARRQISYADLEEEDVGDVNSSPITRDDDGDEYEQDQEEIGTRRDNRNQSHSKRPRSDPVYGQKSAFPGLDDPYGSDELFYGPAEDGLEYLRMVR